MLYTVHTDTLALSFMHTNTQTVLAAYTCKSYTHQSRPGTRGEQPGITPKKLNPLYQTAICHYQSSSTGCCFHQAAAQRQRACWSQRRHRGKVRDFIFLHYLHQLLRPSKGALLYSFKMTEKTLASCTVLCHMLSIAVFLLNQFSLLFYSSTEATN